MKNKLSLTVDLTFSENADLANNEKRLVALNVRNALCDVIGNNGELVPDTNNFITKEISVTVKTEDSNTTISMDTTFGR